MNVGPDWLRAWTDIQTVKPSSCVLASAVTSRLVARLDRHSNGALFKKTSMKNMLDALTTKTGWRACICLACLWVLSLPQEGFSDEPGIPYEVVMRGIGTSALESLLRSVSHCEQEKDSLPSSRFVLVRRAKKDLKQFRTALRSRGHFAVEAEVSVEFDVPAKRVAPASDTRKASDDRDTYGFAPPPGRPVARVMFHVQPGPLYRFDRITLHVTPEEGGLSPVPSPASLGLVRGEGAVSRTIFSAEEHLLEEAKKQGFAFAKTQKRRTQVDHDHHTLNVDLFLQAGQKIPLGIVTLKGIEGIDEAHLMARIPWKPGVLYHPERMENTRQALLETGLFSIVRIHVAEEPDTQGTHPVTIDLVQRKHRSITSGLGYGTGTGARIAASWEHRNIFSAGEKLRLEGHAALETLHLKTSYGKPDFLRIHQKLLAFAILDREETEAYHRDSFGLEVGLARPLAPHVDLTYGVGYRVETVIDISDETEESFGLFSTPVKVTWDMRDDLLDPSDGWYLNLAGAGILDTLGTGVWFGKFSSRYRHYHQLLEDPRLILAGRIGIGTILGPGQKEIPADERFFVGGGGSLRGFGFQMANDVGTDKKPVGGRSMLEFSVETRWQATQAVGVVLFMDGGRAFSESFPTVDKEIFLGPGVGVRYGTPIGPLRLDVGIPLNARTDVDAAYQIYLSIGQAF